MNWGWLLALGIIQLVFGIVGLVMAVTLTFATILIYGILLFVQAARRLCIPLRQKVGEVFCCT